MTYLSLLLLFGRPKTWYFPYSDFLFALNSGYCSGSPRVNAPPQQMGSFPGLLSLGLTFSPGVPGICCCVSNQVAASSPLSHTASHLPYSVGQPITKAAQTSREETQTSAPNERRVRKFAHRSLKCHQVSRAQQIEPWHHAAKTSVTCSPFST